MACCLMAPSHYQNQCWFIISEILWHSPGSNFRENAEDIYTHVLDMTYELKGSHPHSLLSPHLIFRESKSGILYEFCLIKTCIVQCGSVITWSSFLKIIITSDLRLVAVIAVAYVISWYIWSRYNGSQLYIRVPTGPGKLKNKIFWKSHGTFFLRYFRESWYICKTKKKRCCICNVLSHWPRPCSTIDRKHRCTE